MIIYLIIMLIVAVIANYCRPHEPLFENIVLGIAWPLTISYYTLVLLVILGTGVLEILIPKLWSIVAKVSSIIIKWTVTTTNVLRRKVKYAIWCKDTETGKVQKYMDLGSRLWRNLKE